MIGHRSHAAPDKGTEQAFNAWLEDLRQLAEQQDAGWLFACDTTPLRAEYAAGKAPVEVLESFDGMTQWRGCACGGGS